MTKNVLSIKKGLYYHQKSKKFYFVFGVAISCNNHGSGDPVVVYKGQDNEMHYRDYKEFIEYVEIEGGIKVPRFEKV